jgi:multiple sugar transport system permease protein
MRRGWRPWLVYGLLGFWSLVSLFPLYWLGVTSLKRGDEVLAGPSYLPFVDFMPSLDAWRFILTTSPDRLLQRYMNSAVVSLAATALTMLAAAMAVYGFTRWPRRHDGAIWWGLIATRILPPIVIVLPIYLMAYEAGLRDTWGALILAYAAVNLPLALWLLRPVLGERASDQEEAARLEGASQTAIFFDVLLPMAAGGLAAVAFLIFTLCWNEYLLAAYLTADHAGTVPPWIVGQVSFKEAQTGAENEEWPHVSAAIVLTVLPLILLAGAVQRALSRAELWRR